MNVLLITAHPSSQGFTHKIAKHYTTGAKSVGHDVQLINLYTFEPRLPYVEYENFKDWKKDDHLRKPYMDAIEKADKIVFIHPLWWGSQPAILKNFIDQIFVPGFAYSFGSRILVPRKYEFLPMGHLKAKKATVIITFDAFYIMYVFLFMPFLIVWYFFILFFCGLWRSNFHLLSRTGFRSESYREKWLKRAEKWGRQS